VRPNGTKLWLYRYRFDGKRKNMSFGIFPAVGLKAARDKRHDVNGARWQEPIGCVAEAAGNAAERRGRRW